MASSSPESSPVIINSSITAFGDMPHFEQKNFVYNFKDIEDSSTDWDQYYPYQLMVVNAEEDGTYVPIPTWRFTLPMAPESLSITMQTADTVEATLNGYTEKLGGAPFREISLTGTTGIHLGRGNVEGAPSSDGVIIAQALVNSTRAIQNDLSALITGSPIRIQNEIEPKKTDKFPFQTTGFMQFHALRTFLEGYIALKQMDSIPDKDVTGQSQNAKTNYKPENLRLAFCTWKDHAFYLCTLKSFEMRRSASSPLEYTYSLQLRAFRREKLNAALGTKPQTRQTASPSPNIVEDVLNRVQAARNVIASTKKFLSAVVLGPLSVISELSRQVTGSVKDAAGLVRNVAEMPYSFASGVLKEIRQARLDVEGAKATVNQNYKRLYDGLSQEAKVALGIQDVDVKLSKISSEYAVNGSSNKEKQINDGSKRLGNINDPSATDPRDVPEFSEITATAASSATDLRNQLNAEVAKGKSITPSDLAIIRTQMQDASDQIAASIGVIPEAYRAIYGLASDGSDGASEPTPEELDVLAAINEVIMATDKYISYLQNRNNQVDPAPTSLEYVAGLAERSGIAFTIPRSKFLVPFPYGASLEGLALRYLGNANRWHEIATLNGLRAPYVDEVGFSLPLLVNGDSDVVAVSDITNLAIKQTVYISSRTQNRTARHITRIDEFGPNNFLVTLDGDKNLDLFTTADHAVLESFLPGTVNSRQSIYIPSQSFPDDPKDIEAIPGVDIFDPLLKVAGIDWLLDNKMQLIVTEQGDSPLAYGLQAIVQTLQVGLTTPKGSLKQHPSFGSGIAPGSTNSEVDIRDVVNNARDFVNSDPTFSGLKRADVIESANKLSMNVVVGVANFNKPVPVLFSLN